MEFCSNWFHMRYSFKYYVKIFLKHKNIILIINYLLLLLFIKRNGPAKNVFFLMRSWQVFDFQSMYQIIYTIFRCTYQVAIESHHLYVQLLHNVHQMGLTVFWGLHSQTLVQQGLNLCVFNTILLGCSMIIHLTVSFVSSFNNISKPIIRV